MCFDLFMSVNKVMDILKCHFELSTQNIHCLWLSSAPVICQNKQNKKFNRHIFLMHKIFVNI